MNNENNNKETYNDLLEKASFYILNHKYSEAAKVLKKAVNIDEADPHAHYLYGLALEGSNELEEAKKHFRRVLEIDPNHPEAQQHLARLIGE